MAYVVAQPCVGCTFTDCVEVCPVDCFYVGPNFIAIHPDECIDCDACAPACPVEAIYPEDELPEEWAHYQKCVGFEGKFWARIPLGESRFDVATRVHQAFSTFTRDARLGTKDIIVVGHGVMLRAFVMMWCHRTPEWFEQEPNPKNCALRLIDGSNDRGYLFDGFS